VLKCAKCNGTLSILYDYGRVAESISRDTLRIRRGSAQERYLELLPILRESIITLGEGGTNLKRCTRTQRELNCDNLYAKDETTNPTGSFKDRAAAVAISKAVQFGYKTVVCSSSGNAGCAVSAYSAKAGMEAYVYCPSDVPRGKMRQIQMYGAQIFLGEELSGLVERASEKFGWYPFATIRSVNPYQWEGPKTIAYEICEQLGWRAPDWVLIPVGGGGNLSAAWNGFLEFHKLGLIEKTPSICAVQPDGSRSVVEAYEHGSEVKRHEQADTIVKSLLVPLAPDGSSALGAIKASKGCAISVPDGETLKMEKTLASEEGILVEPAGAISFAAVRALRDRGLADRDDTIVCYATGIGFKQPEVFDQMCPNPSRISSFADFERILEAKAATH
jgi:threonine synthase